MSDFIVYDDIHISKEMWQYYEIRTNKHILSVLDFCRKIKDLNDKRFLDIIERGYCHDDSKWKYPEIYPYVYISWNYYCKNKGIKFELTESQKSKMEASTLHHIINNEHHPEYWSKDKSELLNKNDRDGIPDKIIDATAMDDLSIAEMVADWCAMSKERNNTPKEWADKVINKRWKFSEYQINLIYDLLSKIW